MRRILVRTFDGRLVQTRDAEATQQVVDAAAADLPPGGTRVVVVDEVASVELSGPTRDIHRARTIVLFIDDEAVIDELDTRLEPGDLAAIQRIIVERHRQIRKWGNQTHPHWTWLAILMEEVGEVAKAILEGPWSAAMDELVQVAAVCVAWLGQVHRAEQEEQE